MKHPKFLQPKEIEGAALRVLGEYCRTYQQPFCPVVPVEGIIESMMKLELSFVIMTEKFASDDILGAISVNERTIFVDESLDPDTFPEKEGRYRFTLAHEIGHWVLHRHEVTSAAQGSLFADDASGRILCRASQKYDAREWQANQFAAYLLMPTELVRDAWVWASGAADPVIVSKHELTHQRWSLGEDYVSTHTFARLMAGKFHVSNQAMQLRLEGMHLLVTEQAESALTI
ncbi:MAG: ImmA/IrrE family metallo-endopeptidase [Armatimonadota bacterium]